MRIGIDARFIDERFIGVGRYSYAMIRELAKIDSRNKYIIFKNSKFQQRIVSQHNFTEVPVPSKPISFGTWFFLPAVFLREKLDILHSHFYITPMVYSYKSIVTVHDFHALVVNNFLAERNVFIEKGAYWFHRIGIYSSIKRAAKIIFVSEATQKDAIALYKTLPPHCVIYEGAEKHFYAGIADNELRRVREKYRLPAKYLLYVGNTKPHKNHAVLLKSFRRLLEIDPSLEDIRLVLAGKKDRFFPKLRELIRVLKLEKNIVFIDYIDENELAAVYNAAELFVFLSTREGFGLPVLEAMTCGVPVIAANAASLPEVVGDAGILVDPYDIDEIARKIRELLLNQSLRESYSKKGIDRSKEFSWKKSAEETLQVYEEVYRSDD